MKKLIYITALYPAILILAGCTSTPASVPCQIANTGSSIAECDPSAPIPSRKGSLTIKTSFKTHQRDYYPLESDDSFHGSERIPIKVTINDAHVLWHISGKPHSLPSYNPDGSRNRNPEAGEGMMYTLEKTIIVDPGTYIITVTIGNDITVENIDVVIEPGIPQIVELLPEYYFCTRGSRSRSHFHGIADFHAKKSVSRVPEN